jgi:dipeptidyl aminopeptidase/acylaminoacyl peptidase
MGEHFVQPADPRRLESYRHVLQCFAKACELAPFPIERVLVPFEGTTLPAYFMPSGEGRNPAVIFVCGLDTTKELWFLRARQQFTSRGLSCLFIDTPGIGEALRLQKLYTRPDYERPVGAAIDYLSARPDVNPERIGLVGSSLGGYYVARAAAFDPRLRATTAWGAIYDYHRVWVRRLSSGGAIAAPTFQLRFVTGAATIEDAVDRIADFKIAPFANRIRCPFLIVHGADDRQVLIDDAQAMFAAIGSSDKHLKIFSGEDGGSAHTQFDNHLPAVHYVADWMAGKLL